MVQCAECKYCRLFLDETTSSRHYICEYNQTEYLAYDDSVEVSCPNFKLRSAPPSTQNIPTHRKIMDRIVMNYPPFARRKLAK